MNMRFLVLRSRMRFACQVSAISLMAGLGIGCSSDFTRFDHNLYATAKPDMVESGNAHSNSYPDDLDSTVTSSVSDNSGRHRYERAPLPVATLEPRKLNEAGKKNPLVNDNHNYTRSDEQQSRYTGSTPSHNSGYAAGKGSQKIVRSELPEPNAYKTDSLQTGAVDAKRDQKLSASSADKKGWSSSGGTMLRLREGETVYNLSRRYGVPVHEIMKANAISNADNVKAGTMILIPAYVYSADAPISAPDNNPGTRYARASTGSIVAPPADNIPLPSKKPSAYDGPMRVTQLRQPDSVSNRVAEPVIRHDAAYIVNSGDTLSRIARNNDVSVSALMAANDLSDSNLRVGQKLVVPAKRSVSRNLGPQPQIADTSDIAERGTSPSNADENANGQPKMALLDRGAPERTGISVFRWPVRGRVISAFGENVNGARNDGIDISVPEGTAVKAVENGVIVYAGDELEGFGNLVLVRHADGWVSAYAHNKSIEVKRGTEVRRGEIIARSGRTGNADMPKLHFELRKNSTPVNPLQHLGSV
jgi:murein DD-endopeptidase MepM/ murein hydrolase activator NlpD